MRLNLSLNGVLVASTALDPSRCKDKYYLEAMRRSLLRQNTEILSLIPAKPIYYIEAPASSAHLLFSKADTQRRTETLDVIINYTDGINLERFARFSNN